MICSICGQKIEPIEDEPGEWRHVEGADLMRCAIMDCLGEAVPKDEVK